MNAILVTLKVIIRQFIYVVVSNKLIIIGNMFSCTVMQQYDPVTYIQNVIILMIGEYNAFCFGAPADGSLKIISLYG